MSNRPAVAVFCFHDDLDLLAKDFMAECFSRCLTKRHSQFWSIYGIKSNLKLLLIFG